MTRFEFVKDTGRKGVITFIVKVITFIVKVITSGMRWCLNINVLHVSKRGHVRGKEDAWSPYINDQICIQLSPCDTHPTKSHICLVVTLKSWQFCNYNSTLCKIYFNALRQGHVGSHQWLTCCACRKLVRNKGACSRVTTKHRSLKICLKW